MRKRSPSYEMDGGHGRRNRKETRYSNTFYVVCGKNVISAQMLEVSLIINRSRSGAPSRKGCVVNGQMSKATDKLVTPPSTINSVTIK